MKRLSVFVIAMFIIFGMGNIVKADERFLIAGIDVTDTSNTSKLPQGVYYEKKTNTITFNNCNYKSTDWGFGENSKYIIEYYGTNVLNICFIGDNQFMGAKDKLDDYYSYSLGGIYIDKAPLNIFGNGSVKLENVKFFVSNRAAWWLNSDSLQGDISINGITIATNGDGICNHSGNVSITNSTIAINNVYSTFERVGISAGAIFKVDENTNEYIYGQFGGKLTIQNSNIECINCDTALACNSFDFGGEYVYTGNNKPEKILQATDMFIIGTQNRLSTNLKYINVSATKLNISDGNPTIKENPTTKPNLTVNPTKKNTQSTVVKKTSATKITKIKKAKKSLKISWKKVKNVNGYQIQYSTSSKFKNAKKVTIKKVKITSKTIKKLKAKKKYYIRIRTYITVNGKKEYSNWSKKKCQKTK